MHTPLGNRGAHCCALLILLILLSLTSGLASASDRNPAPPPTDSLVGPQTYAPDMEIPFSGNTVRLDYLRHRQATILDSKSRGRDDVGGDDVLIDEAPYCYGIDYTMSTSGDMYCVLEVGPEDNNIGLEIHRSTDGGHSWYLWSAFRDPDPLVDYVDPSILIAEGNEDKIFLAWAHWDANTHISKIQLATSPLGGAASWTTTDVHTQSGYCLGPDLATDALSYSNYYVYMAFRGSVSASSEVYFTRTTDYGATWQSPYVIAQLNMSDRAYWSPKVCYGFGTYIHVTYTFHITADGYDDAVRFQQVDSFASGGQASWSPIYALTSAINGEDEVAVDIAAASAGSQVLVGFDRLEVGSPYLLPSQVVVSENQGGSFGSPVSLGDNFYRLGNIVQNPANSNWMVSGTRYSRAGYVEAAAASISSWSEHHALADNSPCYDSLLALDPTQAYEPALAWIHSSGDGWEFRWDATWRDDEGYPNHEPGFPLDLDYQPVTDPTLADLDGDGHKEIIFADAGGYVHAIQYHGAELSGWPAILPYAPAPGPIAVGDMNGDGHPTILVGTIAGLVAGYNPDGNVAPGWPLFTGSGEPVTVTIANLGPPYPRVAVTNDGNSIQFFNYAGRRVPGTTTWGYSGFNMTPGVAVGDLTGDGVNEVVYCINNVVLAREMLGGPNTLYRAIGSYPSTTPSLGDFDLDGDVEVAVGTVDGLVYLLDDDGSDFPGAWPFDTGIETAMTRIAIGHVRGSFEPEIAVSSQNWHTYLLWDDGSVASGYPYASDNWYIYGGPIMEFVEGASTDVVIGARGRKGWAFDNMGELIPGWPKLFENHCQLTPAVGDLDLDNSNEFVFLTIDQLVVVDVNHTPDIDSHSWRMAAHDAANTGCSDCPEDLVSAVGDDSVAGITRVSFAAPSPNPMSGPASFRFAVPVRAQVELAVYDVRGHRVALVQREETTPGTHVFEWNGKDDSGRALASGNYLATLKVRGPGVDQTLSRKVTVLR
jgi:hypothetical protein